MRSARIPLAAAAIALSLAVGGCAAVGPAPSPSPTPKVGVSPTPPPLVMGVLPLGGVAAVPNLAGPYQAPGQLLVGPRTVRAAEVLPSPATALSELAGKLGVPGPPISIGGGLAYNLGSTVGYQLTATAGLLTFNFHPNTPVEETGATPSVLAAEQFVERFLAAHSVPGVGGGLLPLPQLTVAHAADRRVFFQWTQNGYPVVNIQGQPQEIYADVAANYRAQLTLVGITGQVPFPVVSAVYPYPAISVPQVVKDLNQGVVDPNSYFLQSDQQPYPSPSAAAATTPAALSAAALTVVDSAGYAVPVWVFQVSNRAPTTEFVVCAVTTYACAPLRYNAASPSPGG
ncbi:MAG: hypothetical protein ACYDHB_04250 [Candidatus Dormibacteria bacterium]